MVRVQSKKPKPPEARSDAWANRLCSKNFRSSTRRPFVLLVTLGVEVESPHWSTLASGSVPFTGVASVRYALASGGPVSVRIVDSRGRLVETLVDASQPAGEHQLAWNARDRASGVYFVVVSSGGQTRRGTLILLR